MFYRTIASLVILASPARDEAFPAHFPALCSNASKPHPDRMNPKRESVKLLQVPPPICLQLTDVINI